MKKPWNIWLLGAFAVTLSIAGCERKPDLDSLKAQQLLQAEYDQRPATGVMILVDNLGLRQGLDAKYWKLTKVYPNKLWADYTLTDDARKVLKLPDGGDRIQWRPGADGKFQFYVLTVAANHLRAHDVQEPEQDSIPGAATSKITAFNESVNLEGVPQPLQNIAHNPGNTLSVRRHAAFVLDAGGWKLQSIT